MKKQYLNSLIEFKDDKVNAKTLINEPGYRMLLLTLRAGQKVPEHTAPGVLTVFGISGHLTFYEGDYPSEIHAHEVLTVAHGLPHHLEAHEDSALLVMITGSSNATKNLTPELDLRDVPRPERHSLVFNAFDSLRLKDSFVLVNDHDPVPLHRQIDDRRKGQAGWEYLERGPNVFRVRIERMAGSEISAT